METLNGCFLIQNLLPNQDQNSSKLLTSPSLQTGIFKTCSGQGLSSFSTFTSLSDHPHWKIDRQSNQWQKIFNLPQKQYTNNSPTLPPKLAHHHQYFLPKTIPKRWKLPPQWYKTPSSINASTSYPAAKRAGTPLWEFWSISHKFCSILTTGTSLGLSEQWVSCTSVQWYIYPLTYSKNLAESGGTQMQ